MFLVHNYMRNFLLASLDVIKKPLNNLELIIRAYASTSYSSATASFSSCEKIKKSEMKFDVASKLSFWGESHFEIYVHEFTYHMPNGTK